MIRVASSVPALLSKAKISCRFDPAFASSIRHLNKRTIVCHISYRRLFTSNHSPIPAPLHVDGDPDEQKQSKEEKNLTKEINLQGLKAEVLRASQRAFKKVGKASERLSQAQQSAVKVEDEQLQELQQALELQQKHLRALQELEESLKPIKSTANAQFLTLFQGAAALGVGDCPPPRPERGPKRVRAGPVPPRLPYRVYTSLDGIEIRVGRGAEDNDVLSCGKQYRDAQDWWLHVAGGPGSHVIIRSHRDDLLTALPDTVKDAAVLAVANSKAKTAGRVQVHLTRAKNVSKPPGAKAGTVQLHGELSALGINMKAEVRRLERLEADQEESK